MNSLTTENTESTEMDSVLCHLCVCYGKKVLSQLLDNDLGLLCADCKNEAIRADMELRWATLISPSRE